MEVLPDLQAQQTPAQWITPQLFPLTLPFPLPAGLPLPALLRPEGAPITPFTGAASTFSGSFVAAGLAAIAAIFFV
ncbi:hypothetical protein XPA_002335 [Xanthoria parietina]